MTDLLSTLAARAAGRPSGLRPRVASRFEPQGGLQMPALADVVVETSAEVAAAPATEREPERSVPPAVAAPVREAEAPRQPARVEKPRRHRPVEPPDEEEPTTKRPSPRARTPAPERPQPQQHPIEPKQQRQRAPVPAPELTPPPRHKPVAAETRVLNTPPPPPTPPSLRPQPSDPTPAPATTPRRRVAHAQQQQLPPATPETVVQVTIGRIELRAAPGKAPAAAPATQPPKPAVSLDQYLKQRAGVR